MLGWDGTGEMSGVGLDWIGAIKASLLLVIGVPLLPPCVAAPQRNITDTTAAGIKGEFSFPVRAAVTGLCLGSEPHKLGE